MQSSNKNLDLDIMLEVRSLHRPGSLGKLLTAIGDENGLIGDLKTIYIGKTHSIRQITVSVHDHEHLNRIVKAIHEKTKAKVLKIIDIVFERHLGGKIHSARNEDIKNITDLRYVYT